MYGQIGPDPGFPVGGTPTIRGGTPTFDFTKFSKKVDKIENILGRGGWGWWVCVGEGALARSASLRSATVKIQSLCHQESFVGFNWQLWYFFMFFVGI